MKILPSRSRFSYRAFLFGLLGLICWVGCSDSSTPPTRVIQETAEYSFDDIAAQIAAEESQNGEESP